MTDPGAAFHEAAEETLAAMPADGRPAGERVAEAIETTKRQLGIGFALSVDAFIAAEGPKKAALIGDDDDNLLPRGGLMLLIGKGGKGKTTLTIELAFHLASGVDWLGFAVERPVRVLFIENEGPREPFRRKLAEKRSRWPHELTGGLWVYAADWGQAKLDRDEFVASLNTFVERNEIDLIIGDPLDTFGMQGVGSPEDTRRMVDLLKSAGLGERVAWVLLHHSRKEGAGDAIEEASGAWGGRPDTQLVLEKTKGNVARLSFAKVRYSRRGERGTYLLAFDPESESYELVKEEATEERDLLTEIEEWLSANPHKTNREIAAPTKDGGIGANAEKVKQVLEAHPERFRSLTGEEAKALGRKANATVWEVSRRPETVETVASQEGSEGATDLLTPPYRESVVRTRASSPAPVVRSAPETPEAELATPEEEERIAELLGGGEWE